METATEYHFPGQNFTGPGTHVISRLKQRQKPTNKTDFATLLHDIDYMRTAGNPKAQNAADLRAIKNAGRDLAGLATTIGLGSRSLLGLEFNQASEGDTIEHTRRAGNQALHYVLTDPQYKQYFQDYNIDPLDYTY